MKLSAILLPSLLCAASASAQYFSAGWVPGQPVLNDPPAPGHNFDPAANTPATPGPDAAGADAARANLGLMDRIMTSPPVVSLFSKVGVNITDAVARGAALPWDERIPLITDDNWEEMVVNEPLTEQQEKDRVWIAVISVTAAQNNAVSKVVDQAFDDAYNQTVIAGDLPNVRWARIDYMNVTYLTTKWNVWTGPWIMVITDRGQSLRFYKASGIRLTPELIRELLTEEIWRNSQPWQSAFAPGGKREFVMHYFAFGMMRFYNVVNRVPRFLLMIISGAVASLFMRLLHWPSPAPAPRARPLTASTKSETETVTTTTSAASSSTATPSPSKKAKQRKAGKK
ncbi:hypothetical protein C8Q80DRAFT_1155439 [Daedaleopsis nitida]|nr:hypothetical protein C8Q80DRAFT_1155439 [Daedaleopsis nitida]